MATPSKISSLVAPDRKQREICWKIRDEFFTCLDNALIDDPTKIDTDESIQLIAKKGGCLKMKKDYEKACIGSWAIPTMSRILRLILSEFTLNRQDIKISK
ncbi:10430_t:CDS:2, partial [Acaulospora colombiana]